MDYVLKIIPQMLDGCVVSAQVFFITIVLSIPLGVLLSLGRVSSIKPLQKIIGFYVWVMRGSPLMLQIFFVYFVLPSVGIRLPDFESATVAFVLNYAAYFCEIFRGGMFAIEKGQYEAAQVLGFSKWQTFWKITLPQMLRVCLPSITNETITLVKDTALVTAVGVTEILYFAKTSVNRDVNASAYLVAAIFYLVMNYGLTFLFKRLEKKLKF